MEKTNEFGGKVVGERFNKHWHMATDDHEIALTEVEFSVFRIFSAFNRWMDDLARCCQKDTGQPCSGIDFSILNVIRMHDRPKGISEIGRLLNRDDMSNLQYSVRKLTKHELIEKVGLKGSKKGVLYQTTQKGIEATDMYADYRREILVPLTQSLTTGDGRLMDTSTLLTLLSGIYDQAACVAATHREV